MPHSQQKTEQKYPFEMLFRSIQVNSWFFLIIIYLYQYAMVDNACREFLFVSEFFILDASSALEIFNNIFGKTIQLLVKHTDSHISDSFDCISIFLCIHLVQVELKILVRVKQSLEKWDDCNPDIIRGTNFCATSAVWPAWTSTGRLLLVCSGQCSTP